MGQLPERGLGGEVQTLTCYQVPGSKAVLLGASLCCQKWETRRPRPPCWEALGCTFPWLSPQGRQRRSLASERMRCREWGDPHGPEPSSGATTGPVGPHLMVPCPLWPQEEAGPRWQISPQLRDQGCPLTGLLGPKGHPSQRWVVP